MIAFISGPSMFILDLDIGVFKMGTKCDTLELSVPAGHCLGEVQQENLPSRLTRNMILHLRAKEGFTLWKGNLIRNGLEGKRNLINLCCPQSFPWCSGVCLLVK